MWQANVTLSSTNVLPAKYDFLKEISKQHALSVALIFTAAISLCLATIIAACMVVLRRLATSTGRAGV